VSGVRERAVLPRPDRLRVRRNIPDEWSEGLVGFRPTTVFDISQTEGEPFPNSTPKQPATLATSSPNSSRQPVISASTFGSSRSASGRTVTRRACASTTETVVHQSSKSRRLRTTPIWRQPSSTSTLTHCFTTSSTTRRRSVRSEKSRPKQSPTSPDDTSTWTRATRRSTSRRETGTTVILSPTDSVVSAGQPNESSTQLGNNDERRQYYKDSAES